jgi:excisionase family DNA binding protein
MRKSYPSSAPDRRVLKVCEVPAIYGMSQATIYRHIKEGRLPSAKVGGARMIRVAALEELMNPKPQ